MVRSSPARDPAGSSLQVTREQLEGRLKIAAGINAWPQRDKVHAAIALDAACSGQVDLMRRALASINAFTTRDDAAGRAALILGRRGQLDDATRVASTINAWPLRDETLARLAGGDWHCPRHACGG